jgi:NAD(P)-dependent dehydrogenase (short-subunit alcohol dehydrogenase family)
VTHPTAKVTIVTGASQGIGAGVVAGFRGAGYSVVGTARSMPASDDPDYVTVEGDITDAGTASRVVQCALDRFGRVDCLVNNAGVFVGKPFTEYTDADFARVVAVNLTGFFHVTQHAIASMVDHGGGHVVNVSASLVDHADSTSPSALASLTKGGLAAVTRSLATEYADRGVRVNAVAPGVIRTPVHDPASYDGMAARVPLGRLGAVDDIVDAILYLERAGFVTGEIVHVDGGWTAGH